MQPFCFFVATKEVGVWGLVPTNKKLEKYFLTDLKTLVYIRTTILYKFFIVLFPQLAPTGTSFGRGADFVKVAKSANYFSYLDTLFKSANKNHINFYFKCSIIY